MIADIPREERSGRLVGAGLAAAAVDDFLRELDSAGMDYAGADAA